MLARRVDGVVRRRTELRPHEHRKVVRVDLAVADALAAAGDRVAERVIQRRRPRVVARDVLANVPGSAATRRGRAAREVGWRAEWSAPG
eukprot:5215309-Prymnesium_polylepis.1